MAQNLREKKVCIMCQLKNPNKPKCQYQLFCYHFYNRSCGCSLYFHLPISTFHFTSRLSASCNIITQHCEVLSPHGTTAVSSTAHCAILSGNLTQQVREKNRTHQKKKKKKRKTISQLKCYSLPKTEIKLEDFILPFKTGYQNLYNTYREPFDLREVA